MRNTDDRAPDKLNPLTGREPNMVKTTISEINLASLLDLVKTPEAGAIDIFLGTTRNHSDGRKVIHLEYEAYEPMATSMMQELESRACATWPVHRIAIIHRIGKVDVGETSVAIAVSASHRKDAFEACRFVIDELKKNVPIWKREFFADGSVEWSGVSETVHIPSLSPSERRG